jgi:haloalkane dehalogenase
MEIRPGVLRTPDDRFDGLPGYAFAPNYVEVQDARLGALRMHYVDQGPANAPVVLMLHGGPTWEVLEGFERPFLTSFSDSDPSTIAWEAIFQARVPGAAGRPHRRIERAGHFVQEEQGEALAAVLLEFLADNEALR